MIVSLATLLIATPSAAFASWASGAAGQASTRAQSVPIGPTPTASVSGRNVIVSWTAITMPGGAPLGGYRVTRYDGASVPQTIGAGCTGTVAALSCTEAAVPPGSWTYSVAGRMGSWTGGAGPRSASVTVGAPTLSVTAPAYLSSLPTVLSGSLSNFVSGATVVFRLDNPTTGPVLTGATVPLTIPVDGTASVLVTIPLGTADGSHTVYAVDGAGDSAGASIAIDRTGPAVAVTAIIKSQGGTAGYLHQGGTYYAYSSVSDALSGVASVGADVSTLTTGSTNVALAAGSWTIRGVTYNFRSALLTANVVLLPGAKTFTVTATDVVGNITGPGSSTATVDNTAPGGADVQTTNVMGGTAGKAETGDSLTLSFTEGMDAESILSTWSGPATIMTVRLLDRSGSDQLEIWNSANTAQIQVGTIRLGRSNYVTGDVSFAASTMAMSGSAVILTLGVPDYPASIGTVNGNSVLVWTPVATMYDWAANPCGTLPVNEGGANDAEF
jgi:hypothetical protein